MKQEVEIFKVFVKQDFHGSFLIILWLINVYIFIRE